MNIGTKSHFGDWLATHKKLTYSRYSALDTASKLKIQGEYRGRRVPASDTSEVAREHPKDD